MSEMLPAARLVPVPSRSLPGKVSRYCLQVRGWQGCYSWRNAGSLEIDADNVAWAPNRRFVQPLAALLQPHDEWAQEIMDHRMAVILLRKSALLVLSAVNGLPETGASQSLDVGADEGETPAFEEVPTREVISIVRLKAL